MTTHTSPWHRKIATLIAVVATMSYEPQVAATIRNDKLADLSSILGELRKGGFVVYFRHGLTDRTGATDEVADLSKCETQRNLSAEGREQVSQVGKALKALRIPVGAVLASPFCRCMETAARVSGKRYTVDTELRSVVETDEAETKRGAEALRRLLSIPPATATNTVIVSHSANLREATGIWLKEGAAYVFRPVSGGKAQEIAMIPSEDWAKVAKSESSGRSR